MVSKKTPRSTKPSSARAPRKAKTDAPVTERPAARKRTRAAKPTTPQSAAVPPRTVTDEDIRVRAYFLALEYQGSDRNDIDFWLLAERELRGIPEPRD